ncbi:methyltransferase domain-containing protein [Sedimentitalea todarodis]|uniref:Methyltransferase domain-containing protein n=1 Tax=Sedimentitalea todarodis TaxID=1631240 RepID=A0ABU3VDL4_9RHOB|nr:methyltransferase domain-containing protein [Sedimentitalea todarodis]MDU9004265.1 methyltransferase domain-containing protein [Sedimentitalea todarodis]
MTHVPRIFDRNALLRHRSRARADDLFLQQLAVDEIKDRLSMVNRTFNSLAVVTAFPDFWQDHFPDATLELDNDTLDLEAGRYDLVVHAMCLHWSNDPVGQIIQCRRALIPDGLFLGVLLGGRTLHELRSALTDAESRASGGLSPRISPMAEIREVGALLQRAGLSLPVADGHASIARYRDLGHLMHDLRDMGETNALTSRLRRPTRRAVFEMAQAFYRERYATSGGYLPATFEMICLTGWSPDDSQPKPLRPGSAQARLADALMTRETKLSD